MSGKQKEKVTLRKEGRKEGRGRVRRGGWVGVSKGCSLSSSSADSRSPGGEEEEWTGRDGEVKEEEEERASGGGQCLSGTF